MCPAADAEFDPATISILEDAFEVAWTRVRASKAPYGSDDYAPAGRAIIATYIISAAKAGERDPRWLLIRTHRGSHAAMPWPAGAMIAQKFPAHGALHRANPHAV